MKAMEYRPTIKNRYAKKKGEFKMKLTNRSTAIFSAILITAVVGISGCASTGMQRSQEVRTTMQTMDNEIKLIVVQLDATGASLQELIKPGQADVKKAFELYTDNVTKLAEKESNFSRHADEMAARGKEYFKEWKKAGNKYENPGIQELSEERRAAFGEIYGRIAQNSLGAKSAFKAYVSDAKEVQRYLSNDLTTNGIAAIAPIARKLVNEGNTLKYRMTGIQTAIEGARAEMSQSGIRF